MKHIIKLVLLIILFSNLSCNKAFAQYSLTNTKASHQKLETQASPHALIEPEKQSEKKGYISYVFVMFITIILLYALVTFYLYTYAKDFFLFKPKSIKEFVLLPLILLAVKNRYNEEKKTSYRLRVVLKEMKENEQNDKKYSKQQPQKLIDNKEFVKLVEEVVFTIKRCDDRMKTMSDGSTEKLLLTQTLADLKDALERCGLERIPEIYEYNPFLHEPVPIHLAEPGHPVAEVLDSGIKLGNRVFLKTKVKLNN